MSIADTLLPEFDQEMATTRRVVERVPTDKGKWKPHQKSFSLGHLTQLVSGMPGWITNAVTQTSLNLGDYPGYTYEKTEDLLKTFDKQGYCHRERLGLSGAVVFEARRSGLFHRATRGDRAPDDQSPGPPPRSAHGLPAAHRCSGSIDLWTDGGRANARVIAFEEMS